MGVRGFYNYSKKFQRIVPNDKEYRVGIDTLSLLYKFRGDTEKIFNFLKPILHNKLLFVFDGKAPESKSEEIQKRKRSIDSIQEKIDSFKEWLKSDIDENIKELFKKEIEKLQYSSWKMSYEVRKYFKDYLIENNYSFIKSNQEADAVLIDLYYANYIDVVLSSDMDFLIAGIDIVWIPENSEIREVVLDDILQFEEINKEQLKEVAILCGIDNTHISDIESVSIAMNFIRHYGSIESIALHCKNMISLSNDRFVRDMKKRYYPNKVEPFINVKKEHYKFLENFRPKIRDTS
jgi:flap endonuclease-1